MKTRFILCLLSSFVLILSCKKDGNSETDGNGNKNTEPVDSIFVSRTNLQLGMAINAIDTFSIKSNIQWAATVTPAAASWLKIDKNNGVAGTTVVTITALLNNETGTTRTATISITANNNQPITITITQKPFPTYIGWQKVIGGFYTEKARSAAKTSDGGYLIAGYSYGNNTGDITGSHGVEDAVIVKVDANGNKQWVKSYGGSNADEANAIAATSDGNFVVVGYTRSSDGDLSSPRNLDDLWIMKIDGNGTILWSKTYGSSRNDKANAVIVTSDGGLVLAGSTNGYDGDVPGNHSGNFEFWILKLDASGNKLWSKTYGGASTEEAYSITACTDGGFAITGRTASIDGDVTGNHKEYSDDVWVVKVDANGNKLWAKCFGGLDQEWGNSIKSTPDGGLIVAGYTFSVDGDVLGGNHGTLSDAWIIKLNASGTKQWAKTFGGTLSETANSVMLTADGGYMVGGSAGSFDGDVTGYHGGSGDFWIVKMNSGGNLEWNKCYGSSGRDEVLSLIGTDDNGYLLSGTIEKNDQDVKEAVHGELDMWLLKIKTL